MNDGLLSSPIVSFFLAAIVGLAMATLSWFISRRSGLVPAQEALITTLQANTAALQSQVEMLTRQLAAEKQARQDLATRTDQLEEQLADLLVENADLRKQLGMPQKARHV